MNHIDYTDTIILKQNENSDSDFVKSLFPKEVYSDTRHFCSLYAYEHATAENELKKKEYENIKKQIRHQIFSLKVTDSKINDYIKTKEAIIIILDDKIYSEEINNRIKYIINENPKTPILFIFDNIKMNMINDPNEYIKNFVAENRKAFYYSENSINKNEPMTWLNYFLKKIEKKDSIGQNEYSDEELITLFHIQQLPMKNWNHKERLRIVWIHLVKYGYNNCINQNGILCKNWKKYKNSIGHSELWNYTITRFFIELLFPLTKKYNSLNQIWENMNFGHLKDGKLFLKYYTRDALFSEKAKNEYILPNI